MDALARESMGLLSVHGLGDALRFPLRAPTLLRWVLRSAASLIDGHVLPYRLYYHERDYELVKFYEDNGVPEIAPSSLATRPD